MWQLIVPKETLLQHGFIYDEKKKRYIQDFGVSSDGGEAFVNDNEDFFRVEMYCFETLSGDGDVYHQEHIADKDDWTMEDLEKAGIVTFIEHNSRDE